MDEFELKEGLTDEQIIDKIFEVLALIGRGATILPRSANEAVLTATGITVLFQAEEAMKIVSAPKASK